MEYLFATGSSNTSAAIELAEEVSSPTTVQSSGIDSPRQFISQPECRPVDQLQTPTETLPSPIASRKRSAFTIENIMGRGDILGCPDEESPSMKKQRSDIFDSIPSPPPKIADVHSPAVVGVPPFSAHQLYNPFLLNLAARNPAAVHPHNPRALGLVPMMPPFIHPSLVGYPGAQSVL